MSRIKHVSYPDFPRVALRLFRWIPQTAQCRRLRDRDSRRHAETTTENTHPNAARRRPRCRQRIRHRDNRNLISPGTRTEQHVQDTTRRTTGEHQRNHNGCSARHAGSPLTRSNPANTCSRSGQLLRFRPSTPVVRALQGDGRLFHAACVCKQVAPVKRSRVVAQWPAGWVSGQG